jgi:hypothetical protein
MYLPVHDYGNLCCPQIPKVESVSFQIRLSFVAISHISMEEWDAEAFMIW